MKILDTIAIFSAGAIVCGGVSYLLNRGAFTPPAFLVPAQCHAKAWKAPVEMLKAMSSCSYIVHGDEKTVMAMAAVKETARANAHQLVDTLLK